MIIIVSGVQIIVLDIDRCRCSLGDRSLSHVSGRIFPARIERELVEQETFSDGCNAIFGVGCSCSFEIRSLSLKCADIGVTESSESRASPVFGSRNGVSTDIKNAHSSSIMDKPEKCRTLVPDSDRYPGFQLREASDGNNPPFIFTER